jgi:hypothetical protein
MRYNLDCFECGDNIKSFTNLQEAIDAQILHEELFNHIVIIDEHGKSKEVKVKKWKMKEKRTEGKKE